jgi:hypothetical protein
MPHHPAIDAATSGHEYRSIRPTMPQYPAIDAAASGQGIS